MQSKARIYTVSQINLLVKVALEEQLPSRLTVQGEGAAGEIAAALRDVNR